LVTTPITFSFDTVQRQGTVYF